MAPNFHTAFSAAIVDAISLATTISRGNDHIAKGKQKQQQLEQDDMSTTQGSNSNDGYWREATRDSLIEIASSDHIEANLVVDASTVSSVMSDISVVDRKTMAAHDDYWAGNTTAVAATTSSSSLTSEMIVPVPVHVDRTTAAHDDYWAENTASSSSSPSEPVDSCEYWAWDPSSASYEKPRAPKKSVSRRRVVPRNERRSPSTLPLDVRDCDSGSNWQMDAYDAFYDSAADGGMCGEPFDLYATW